MSEHQKYWFQYFPESFMWSQGMMIAIEMARWGGSSMSEVDRVGQRLKGKIGDNEAWGVEWEREAQRIEKMGDDGIPMSKSIEAKETVQFQFNEKGKIIAMVVISNPDEIEAALK